MGEVGGHAVFPRIKGNIELRFESENLTPYAGVYLLREFFKQINLSRDLKKMLKIQKRKRYYNDCEFVLGIIYAILFGFERIPQTNILGIDRAFLGMAGFRCYPDPSSLWRFLMRFDEKQVCQVLRINQTFLRRMLRLQGIKKAIIDMDSTVLTVYGNQEGAAIGYNPSKPGRASYHPICAFLGSSKNYIAGRLRTGDTYTGKDSVEFLREALNALKLNRCNLRADSGFYNSKLVEFCEENSISFAIVAKQTQPLKRLMYGLKYRKVRKNFEDADFFYQPIRWNVARRFIVVRQRIKESLSKQMSFFPEERYRYQVIVTNMKARPHRIWQFYNGRANVENVIKELKLTMNLEKIPTGRFVANQAYFQVIMLAYNLLNWLRQLCLPGPCQGWTAKTIRQSLLLVPGKFTVHGRHRVLSIPDSYIYQKQFLETLKSIRSLKINWS